MELAFLPATEQARLVRERDVSPVELVELYLERIERLDPELGAFVTVCAEAALADARRKADAPADGPFHGVPIALKDLDTTAGIRTTFSCKAFADNVPDFDLAHVAKTRAAGFVVIGKTNTPEFGTTAFTDSPLNGPCRTPWDLGQERRRLQWRRGGRGRCRARRDRPGLRRRRLGPDPGLVQRPLRDQALARPRLERTVRPRDRARHDRSARPYGRRRGLLSRRRLRLRVGRPVPSTRARATFRRGGRSESGPAADRDDDDRRRSRRRSIRRAWPQLGTPPSCSRRSATRSRKPRPTGAARS